MNNHKIEQLQLVEKILALLQAQKTHLSDSELYEVFTQVMQLRRSGIHPQPASPSPAPEAVAIADPPKQVFHYAHYQNHHVLIIEILNKSALQELQQQLQTTNGLWLGISEELPLNMDLPICITAPGAGLETWISGRIVIHTPKGTALDVHSPQLNYHVQWEDLLRQMGPLTHAPIGDLNTIASRAPRLANLSLTPGKEPPRKRETRPEPMDTRPNFNPEEDLEHDYQSFFNEVEESLGLDLEPDPSSISEAPYTRNHRGDEDAHFVEPSSRAFSREQNLPSTRSSQKQNLPNSRSFSNTNRPTHHSTHQTLHHALQQEIPNQTWAIGEHNPMHHLFVSLHQNGDDGFLVLEDHPIPCIMQIQMGCPAEIFLTSAHKALELGPMLLKADKLNDVQHQQALKHVEQYQVTYDEALLRERLLPYPALLQALQGRINVLLHTLLKDANQGTATFYQRNTLPHHYPTPPVSMAKVAYETLRDQNLLLTSQEQEDALIPFRKRPITFIQPPPIPIGELQLADKEQHFFDTVFENSPTLSTLFTISSLGRGLTTAVFLAAQTLGFLRLASIISTRSQQTQLVEDKLEEIQLAASHNHFEILGLHWSAYSSLVEEAYQKTLKTWSLDKFDEAGRAKLQPKVDALLARIKAAHQNLHEDKSRNQYRDSLISGIERRNAILHYFRQGDMNLMRSEFDEAEISFKRVLELDRTHNEARQKLKITLLKKNQPPS